MRSGTDDSKSSSEPEESSLEESSSQRTRFGTDASKSSFCRSLRLGMNANELSTDSESESSSEESPSLRMMFGVVVLFVYMHHI